MKDTPKIQIFNLLTFIEKDINIANFMFIGFYGKQYDFDKITCEIQ